MTAIYSKRVVANGEVKPLYILIENGKIKSVLESYDGEFTDYGDALIFPGWIDQHIHGWGRGSIMYDNSEATIRNMSSDMAREGVTGFLVTTGAAPIEHNLETIKHTNTVLKDPNHKGAEILGMHLEGPFINPVQAGAQQLDACKDPDIELFKKFEEAIEAPNIIRLTTIAPELPGAKELIEYCRDNKIQVSAGHTDATFEQIIESKAWGVGGVTHMYGAMSGMHHRKLGTVGAALYDKDLYCEFAKQTGITVHHEAFDLAYRIKTSDKIIMTTDCIGHARQTEPYYHAKRQVYFIPDGEYLIERKADGSYEKRHNINDYDQIRNIEMSYIDSIQNMLRHTEMSWVDLAKITSLNPAKYIHLSDRKGSIEPGKDADFTIINDDITLVATIVGGEEIYRK